MAQTIELSPLDLLAPHDFARQFVFFSLGDSEQDTAKSVFKIALMNSIRRQPFLAGRVFWHPDTPGHRVLKVFPLIPEDYDPEEDGILKYTCLDKSYQDLRQSNFAKDLGEWSTYHWLPIQASVAEKEEGIPVLQIQMNFLRDGGWVLALAWDHAAVDGTGALFLVTQILAQELRTACSALQLVRKIEPEEACVGLQRFHNPQHNLCTIDRPRELKIKPEDETDTVGQSFGVIKTFKFRIDALQRILRANGTKTSPFRCVSALFFVAATRARLLSNTCSRERAPRCGLITNMHEALGAPVHFIGNRVLYGWFDVEIDDILDGGDLADVPKVITTTLDKICAFTNESRKPEYTHQRLAWLNQQIYDDGVNPMRITYDLDHRNNDCLCNSWEGFGAPPRPFSNPWSAGLRSEAVDIHRRIHARGASRQGL